MIVVRCGQCPWEMQVFEHEAHARLTAHEKLRHPESVPPSAPMTAEEQEHWRVPQMSTADWELRALDAIVHLAADRAEFTLYEISDYGVGEPINPRCDWGQLTRTAEHLQLIKQARHADGSQKFTRSKRPASKGSAVAVWTAGPGLPRHQQRRSHTA